MNSNYKLCMLAASSTYYRNKLSHNEARIEIQQFIIFSQTLLLMVYLVSSFTDSCPIFITNKLHSFSIAWKFHHSLLLSSLFKKKMNIKYILQWWQTVNSLCWLQNLIRMMCRERGRERLWEGTREKAHGGRGICGLSLTAPSAWVRLTGKVMATGLDSGNPWYRALAKVTEKSRFQCWTWWLICKH